MADEDNWESLLEQDTTKVGQTFSFEVDNPQPLENPQNLEAGQIQPPNPDKIAKKAKAAELGKKFEEKIQIYEDAFNTQSRGPLNAEERKRMELLSQVSDQRNTVELFGEFVKTSDSNPKDEDAWVDNAKKIVEILLKEDRKLHIQEFVKELLQGLYSKLTTKEYQEIYNKTLVLLNNKQKDEKPQTGKKKKEVKPMLNVTKATISAKNSKIYDEEEEEEEEEEPYNKFNKDADFM